MPDDFGRDNVIDDRADLVRRLQPLPAADREWVCSYIERLIASRDVAWAAGLFEGEGSWGAQPNRWRGLRAQLSSTDRDVVERFAEIVGCGKIRARDPRAKKAFGSKVQWNWSAARTGDVKALYHRLRPWLHERRRGRFEELLAERVEAESWLPQVRAERNRRAWATRRRGRKQTEALF